MVAKTPFPVKTQPAGPTASAPVLHKKQLCLYFYRRFVIMLSIGNRDLKEAAE